ncbi:MAG TPA: 16S rRNA processing protein RimM [Bacteroidales bacterium]|nr:MAG: 16S rRNA processing protein RimM [Bacteroidetes bacterium GWF2_33_38]OFY86756.1 MAG: 16S rRNA processing protein RimM [Bacteroidetes bacterium RIFOXYA2_FULL_33_7]HBF88319.1 16S rRNA processing protein RimM [Bacteroidales bacterium]
MQDKLYLGQLNNYNLSGEFVLNFEKNIFHELKEKGLIYIEIDNRLVPFFLLSVKRKSRTAAIVKFDDIITPKRLEKLADCKVYIIDSEEEIIQHDNNDDFDINSLIGFSLFDIEKGEIGKVKEINIYSYNVILIVFKGRREILVPYADEIIQEIDFDKKTILANLPEGLLDLYL